MKTIRIIVASILFGLASSAQAAEGLIVIKSANTAEITMDRLEALVKARGFTVFARIDHAAGAKKVGKSLRPTELLIFGNPKGGTPFMQCAQTVGIDLPLKALVWEDANSQVWVGYNDPAYIAERHGVPNCGVVGNIAKTLSGLAGTAAGAK